MKKQVVQFFLAFFVTSSTMAQVAKEDFVKINSVYVSNKHLSFHVKYDVYKNKTSTTVASTESGEIKVKDDERYMHIGTIESIDTKKYHLIVDHDDKNISILGIQPDESVSNTEQNQTLAVDLEKILALCQKVEFKKIGATQNSYELIFPGGEYDMVKLIYNSKTFFIEKMILYYSQAQNLDGDDKGQKEAPRMEVTYSNISVNPNYGNTPFNYDAFLEKYNGKLRAKPAYKTYTVNEQLFD